MSLSCFVCYRPTWTSLIQWSFPLSDGGQVDGALKDARDGGDDFVDAGPNFESGVREKARRMILSVRRLQCVSDRHCLEGTQGDHRSCHALTGVPPVLLRSPRTPPSCSFRDRGAVECDSARPVRRV